jgi:hypothetical protein
LWTKHPLVVQPIRDDLSALEGRRELADRAVGRGQALVRLSAKVIQGRDRIARPVEAGARSAGREVRATGRALDPVPE